MNGRIILYSGPSGAGKGTLRDIFSKNQDLNLGFSISYTTRKQRQTEIHGQDYFFVNDTEFKSMIDQDKFIEWAEFAGNKYGTSKPYVDSLLKKGFNVILEIETIGAKRILELYPDCLSIFLLPPSIEELKLRLESRSTETPESIATRITRAKEEIKEQNMYKYQVVNHDVKKAAKEIEEIILKELNK